MLLDSLPLILGYAEIHFRFFRLFPSLLYKKQPEVYFDVPRRLEPGEDLPIILIINELQQFPSVLSEVSVAVTMNNIPNLFSFNKLEKFEIIHPLMKNLRAFIFTIKREMIPNGKVFINAKVILKQGKKNRIIFNDNLQTSSKLPFTCFISDNSLPGHEFCMYGDLHVHSHYSQSHVEFGPPVRVIDSVAKASGLDLVGITDHSYDLACSINNYLLQDQSLERWKALRNEIENLNLFKTIIIPGEEVSCLNNSGKVVHLNGLGLSRYIPGTLDGARPNIYFKTQLTIDQAVNEIHQQNGIAFAAHPGSQTGFLQELFLSRGRWSLKELESQLDGIQALNSGFDGAWERGKHLWISMLQKGRRVPLLGGNDAHGDFNRYRALSIPFIKIYEGFERFMGAGKTGIFGKWNSSDQILQQIKNGSTFVTTGPFISISYTESPEQNAISSNTIPSETAYLFVIAVSTEEFGRLEQVKIYCGCENQTEETLIKSTSYKEIIFKTVIPIQLASLPKSRYLRAEAVSTNQERRYIAFSSACFL